MRLAAFAVVLWCFALPARPGEPLPTELGNGGFEEGPAEGTPAGWRFNPKHLEAGARLASTAEAAHSGSRGVSILGPSSGESPRNPVTLSQAIDATRYRGARVRLAAQLRLAAGAGETRAQLWLRVDRPGGVPGFFDNMMDRPVRSQEWTRVEIVGEVALDAERILFGVLVIGGAGPVLADDLTLEVLEEAPSEPPEPPRALGGAGAENLVALARAIGYLRYFHPSDEAAGAAWGGVAVQGVRTVEGAADPVALARVLSESLGQLAPSAKFLAPGERAPRLVRPAGAVRQVRWRHVGPGGGIERSERGSVYSSTRERSTSDRTPPGWQPPDRPLVLTLGRGVRLALPTTVWADGEGRTVPRGGGRSPEVRTANSADRATRLAAVTLAWAELQHFYPYFDVVRVDWAAELPAALRRAAEAPDEAAFGSSLRLMLARLRDGHAWATGAFAPRGWAPVRLRVLGERAFVEAVASGTVGLEPGSELLTVDGAPVAARLAALLEEAPAATVPAARAVVAMTLLRGAPGTTVRLGIRTPAGEERAVDLTRRDGLPELEFAQGDAVRELEPGTWYVDLRRATDDALSPRWPSLAAARAVVFDLRGYPAQNFTRVLARLSGAPIESARWNLPIITKPDRQGWEWARSRWTVEPETPGIRGKVIFLTDARAVSAAETCMGMVEAYRLGEIVGEPTAGTNGNVTFVQLPAGAGFSFTGMKVLKHDGSRHHGVGIRPTVQVTPTAEGIAGGRDEVLERAIAIARGP